jgi:cysteine desulfurase
MALQSINSETGTVLIPHAGTPALQQVRDAGGLFLADCSQSAGRVPLPDADMIVVSAHKLGGPIGIGALLVRDFAMLEPSGGQERGYRSGTENLPGALGFAAALEAGGIAAGRRLIRSATTSRTCSSTTARCCSARPAVLAHPGRAHRPAERGRC